MPRTPLIVLALAGCLRPVAAPLDAGADGVDGGAAIDAGLWTCRDAGFCDVLCPCPDAAEFCDLLLAPCAAVDEAVSLGGECRPKAACDGGTCQGARCASDLQCGPLVCDAGSCAAPQPGVGPGGCAGGCLLIELARASGPICACPSCQ